MHFLVPWMMKQCCWSKRILWVSRCCIFWLCRICSITLLQMTDQWNLPVIGWSAVVWHSSWRPSWLLLSSATLPCDKGLKRSVGEQDWCYFSSCFHDRNLLVNCRDLLPNGGLSHGAVSSHILCRWYILGHQGMSLDLEKAAWMCLLWKHWETDNSGWLLWLGGHYGWLHLSLSSREIPLLSHFLPLTKDHSFFGLLPSPVTRLFTFIIKFHGNKFLIGAGRRLETDSTFSCCLALESYTYRKSVWWLAELSA